MKCCCAAVLLAVALASLTGCGGTGPPMGEPIYNSDEHGIRFDGLYVDRQANSSMFLRFYPDGVCVWAEGNTTAEGIARYMIRSHHESTAGTFEISGKTVTASVGELEYEGAIDKGKIYMEVYNVTTEGWEERTYRFAEVELPNR
jgi:hypothetical protein